MPHFGSAVLLDRLVRLLQQELAGELALVDAAANARAVASTPEYEFTTTCPTESAIAGFFDGGLDVDQSVTVLEADVGRTHDERHQQLPVEGAPANRPRLHLLHGFVIRARCASRRGGWTPDGAYRRCDRLSTAIVVILGRFNRLGVPAPAGLPPLAHEPVRIISDRRPSHVEEGNRLVVARDIGILVSTLEDR